MSEIKITDFHVAGSMGGWLTIPREMDLNEIAVSEALKRVEKMWGQNRPLLICPPSGTVPQRAFHAWLVGPEKDKTMHGSHLIVIWFGDNIPEDPLRSAMMRVQEHGGWDQHARDFEY